MGSVLHYVDGDTIQQVTPAKPLPVSSSAPLTVRIDDAGAYQYFGKATVASDDGSAVWQISRLSTANPQSLLWADGDAEFNNVWSARTSLTYS